MSIHWLCVFVSYPSYNTSLIWHQKVAQTCKRFSKYIINSHVLWALAGFTFVLKHQRVGMKYLKRMNWKILHVSDVGLIHILPHTLPGRLSKIPQILKAIRRSIEPRIYHFLKYINRRFSNVLGVFACRKLGTLHVHLMLFLRHSEISCVAMNYNRLASTRRVLSHLILWEI
jgi:hypothetical protein